MLCFRGFPWIRLYFERRFSQLAKSPPFEGQRVPSFGLKPFSTPRSIWMRSIADTLSAASCWRPVLLNRSPSYFTCAVCSRYRSNTVTTRFFTIVRSRT